jgi:hypothetical protein
MLSYWQAEMMLDAIGLNDYFDELIIGAECARAKPHPDPYQVQLRPPHIHGDMQWSLRIRSQPCFVRWWRVGVSRRLLQPLSIRALCLMNVTTLA